MTKKPEDQLEEVFKTIREALTKLDETLKETDSNMEKWDKLIKDISDDAKNQKERLVYA